MKKKTSRVERVAHLLQRELARLIQHEIKDPRLPAFVTISAVEVSPDLSYAKVYITVLGDEEKIKMTVEILNSAEGFLRSFLGKILKLRIIPHLRFIYDSSMSEGNRLQTLIDQAISTDKNRE